MTDTTKPATTLSDEDAAEVDIQMTGSPPLEVRELVRIIRELDARLALSIANERAAEYEIRDVNERLRVVAEAIEHAIAAHSSTREAILRSAYAALLKAPASDAAPKETT